MSNFNKNQDSRLIINHQIRSTQVLCIDQDNANLGILSLSKALALAAEKGLDLVQMSPPNKDRLPTCKFLDSGKYKYELSKKKKEADKKQRESAIKVKEIKFRPSTDSNDLKTKARKAEEFIGEGCKVKVTITLKGREASHQNLVAETLDLFMGFLPNCQLLGKPVLTIINPNKKDLHVFIAKKETAADTKTA